MLVMVITSWSHIVAAVIIELNVLPKAKRRAVKGQSDTYIFCVYAGRRGGVHKVFGIDL